MKVIFLDVDGVLNSMRNVVAFGAYPFPNHQDDVKTAESNLDRIAIGMVRKLCEEFDAKIVLHSTWRASVDPVEFGKKYNLPIVAGTSSRVTKPLSIKMYLDAHPEITCYVVLDDDDMHVGGRQITTNTYEGLSYANYEAARRKLAMAEGMGRPSYA